MGHILKVRRIEPLTHNVYHLTVTKPEGFTFTPGQATEMTLKKDGWRDEARPFTFTSRPDAPDLEFVIKSYPSHGGVTEQVAKLQPGDEVEIGDAWGAIKDKGAGVFIAGGAGVTPFIPILRERARNGSLAGCTLVLGAKQERDLILRDEWDAMEGLDTRYVLSDEVVKGHDHGQIGLGLLNTYTQGRGEGDHMFYVCGPKPMENSVVENLTSLGVATDRIVTES